MPPTKRTSSLSLPSCSTALEKLSVMRRWWSASVCPKCRIKVNQASQSGHGRRHAAKNQLHGPPCPPPRRREPWRHRPGHRPLADRCRPRPPVPWQRRRVRPPGDGPYRPHQRVKPPHLPAFPPDRSSHRLQPTCRKHGCGPGRPHIMWPQPFLGVGPEDPDHDPQIAATAALQRRLGEECSN